MINNSKRSWDVYFINLALLASTMSKDPSTKVGAVLVKDKVILSTGYNGFPRGCNDMDKERYERPEKYDWTVHAEENVLFNAARRGQSTIGTTLYVTALRPCNHCARSMIQCGVSKIVCFPTEEREDWDKSFEVSKVMLVEAGVKYIEIKEDELG